MTTKNAFSIYSSAIDALHSYEADSCVHDATHYHKILTDCRKKLFSLEKKISALAKKIGVKEIALSNKDPIFDAINFFNNEVDNINSAIKKELNDDNINEYHNSVIDIDCFYTLLLKVDSAEEFYDKHAKMCKMVFGDADKLVYTLSQKLDGGMENIFCNSIIKQLNVFKENFSLKWGDKAIYFKELKNAFSLSKIKDINDAIKAAEIEIKNQEAQKEFNIKNQESQKEINTEPKKEINIEKAQNSTTEMSTPHECHLNNDEVSLKVKKMANIIRITHDCLKEDAKNHFFIFILTFGILYFLTDWQASTPAFFVFIINIFFSNHFFKKDECNPYLLTGSYYSKLTDKLFFMNFILLFFQFILGAVSLWFYGFYSNFGLFPITLKSMLEFVLLGPLAAICGSSLCISLMYFYAAKNFFKKIGLVDM